MNERASAFASRLQRQGLYLGILTLFLMLLLLLGDERGWGHALAVASGLIVLFFAVYMLFDAALFRLIASHASEEEGCHAVDTLLARLHLRKLPQATPLLDARMAGTNRLLLKLHLAFAAFLVLFAAITTYGLWGHP
ncbi:hypothetical protein [Phyllobacterium sp. SB3]|uniref:hypothetical protein n=1 Tax=Phyllobacterium sp. SB3 TaxID=3156073 RepID=UPI0032AF87B2